MKNKLFLTQTDTTIGFVSQDASKIDKAKRRLPDKHYIRTVDSLRTLKKFTRVPEQHKNRVRRAKRVTFIINGNSYRVVKDEEHNLLLNRVGWFYSSSANLSGESYSQAYAEKETEVLVSFPRKSVGQSSTIYRLGVKNLKSIR